jgi:hypothetical protein
VFPAANPPLPAGYPRLQGLLGDLLCRDPDRRLRSNEIVGRVGALLWPSRPTAPLPVVPSVAQETADVVASVASFLAGPGDAKGRPFTQFAAPADFLHAWYLLHRCGQCIGMPECALRAPTWSVRQQLPFADLFQQLMHMGYPVEHISAHLRRLRRRPRPVVRLRMEDALLLIPEPPARARGEGGPVVDAEDVWPEAGDSVVGALIGRR